MPDIGGLEMLVVTLGVWGVAVFALYWLIRLAVNHGIQDAHKYGGVPARGGDATDRRPTP